jgi:hypothetical protein
MRWGRVNSAANSGDFGVRSASLLMSVLKVAAV